MQNRDHQGNQESQEMKETSAQRSEFKCDAQTDLTLSFNLNSHLYSWGSASLGNQSTKRWTLTGPSNWRDLRNSTCSNTAHYHLHSCKYSYIQFSINVCLIHRVHLDPEEQLELQVLLVLLVPLGLW